MSSPGATPVRTSTERQMLSIVYALVQAAFGPKPQPVYGRRVLHTLLQRLQEVGIVPSPVMSQGRCALGRLSAEGRRLLGHELTDRELQVLVGMSRGCTNARIAEELGVSEDTVKCHVRRLFMKIGARDRANAVAIGYEHHLLPIDL